MFKFISFVLVISFMMVFGSGNLLAAEQKKIIGEFLAGGLGGIAGMFGGCGLGYAWGSTKMDEQPWEEDPRACLGVTGGLVGIPIGSAIGVYLVGTIGDEKGSFGATFGGSVLGGIVGSIGSIIAGGYSKLDYPPALIVPVMLGTAIGATIAFNLTSERESSAASTNAAPPIYLDLVKVRFKIRQTKHWYGKPYAISQQEYHRNAKSFFPYSL